MAEPEEEPDQTAPAPAEPPPAAQDPEPKPEPASESKPGPTIAETTAQIAEALTIFNGTVIAPNMVAGIAADERRGRRRDGKLDDADIQATLRHYVTGSHQSGPALTDGSDASRHSSTYTDFTHTDETDGGTAQSTVDGEFDGPETTVREEDDD